MKGTVTIDLDDFLKYMVLETEIQKYKDASDNWMKSNKELSDKFNMERLEIAQDILIIIKETILQFKSAAVTDADVHFIINTLPQLKQLEIKEIVYLGKSTKSLFPKNLTIQYERTK